MDFVFTKNIAKSSDSHDLENPIWPTLARRLAPRHFGSFHFSQKVRKTPDFFRNPVFLWLRRQDSNLRPPGYEPDELPTALLRDIGFLEA